MGCFGQGRGKIDRPKQGFDPFGAEGLGLGGAARGADHAPAFGDQVSGKGAGRVAMAKGKQD